MSMLLRRYHKRPAETDSLLAENPDRPVEAQEPAGAGKPAGNASREEWAEYAVAQGKFPDALKELSRNEIRDMFETDK
ncbi:hypothetical protein NNX28_16985 [Arthrobacter sp. zg-Y859]|uniref:Uncharacterized protein n=1 Tax=Arthrobacter jinronghuae TaxID=2964609 RepID=A0ABT1NVC2_9MICC|nr:hypothetical protein [Arthrobacter jinronghuae]MCQ1951615.1 hypothetical protein [Arthrobacter jinronghuae]UWX79671.1 hypothetical protein N2K98_05595 [Arthrobacter jinronghuae]